VASIKGFAEWLPEQQILQQEIIDNIRHSFELNGYAPLLTRSIELLEDLLNQGETDKEIYGVQRLSADSDTPSDWGLHYDLTVPFARYVSENRGKIVFPYRRYQIQQAWRGERPQMGRFREFIQADADVVNEGDLDLRFDAEVILMFSQVLSSLSVPKIKILVNNRKLLEGFYLGLGIENIVGVLRIVDKLPKIGEEEVARLLQESGLSSQQAQNCIGLTKIEAKDSAELKNISKFGVSHDMLDLGVRELGEVLDRVNLFAESGSVVAGLHIARGFDYYTGTVVESAFVDHPEVGSVCSGGRYDNLISTGSKPIPGVGLSIGVSRLLAYCFHLDLIETNRQSPAQVFIVVNSEEERTDSEKVAALLRDRDISAVVSDSSAAYGKQIKLAERLGIENVWFPNSDGSHEVKNLETREQIKADPTSWLL